jgi:hypothetical protein
MPSDDQNLISQNTAQRIKKLHTVQNSGKLLNTYTKFISNEKYCSEAIMSLINKSARTIIHNTMFADHIRDNKEDPSDIFSFEDAEEEMSMEEYDPIDKCVDVYQGFANTQFLLQVVFSSGLIYGKAVHESDLESSLADIKVKPNLFDGADIDQVKDMFSKMFGFNVTGIDIEDIDNEKEIDESDRGPTGEEDSGPPEELL